MKKIIFIAFTVFISLYLSAEPGNLQGVLNSITLNKVNEGDFSQEKTVPGMKRSLKSSGKYVFSTEGIIWNTEKPVNSIIALTSSKLIQKSPDGSISVLDASTNKEFKNVSETISSIFNGNINQLEQFFKIDFSAKDESWSMLLSPKSGNISSAINKISIYGSGNTNASKIDSLVLEQADNSCVKYFFTNQKYRDSLSVEEKNFFAQN